MEFNDDVCPSELYAGGTGHKDPCLIDQLIRVLVAAAAMMKVRIYCHSVKVKAAQMIKLRNLLRAMHVSFFAFNLQEPECLF